MSAPAAKSWIPGAMTFGAVLASLGWAIYATVADAMPARAFIDLQAGWDNGRYGVKLTFACAWLSILGGPTTAALLALPIVQRVRRSAIPSAAGWVAIEERPRPAFAVWAAALGTASVALIYLFVTLPHAFAAMPVVGKILLVLTPVLSVAGAGCIAEALGLDQTKVERIVAVEMQPKPGSETSMDHVLVTDTGRHTIAEATARQLQVGTRVRITASPMETAVLVVAVPAPIAG